jgi:hypothetical protein
VVVGDDDVAQRRQPLLDALDPDLVRQAVAQVLQLLVRRRCRYDQAFAVATNARVKVSVFAVELDLVP